MIATIGETPHMATVEEVVEEEEELDENNSSKEEYTMKTMQLNEAFEALEAMRKVNLEVEFAGTMENVDPMLLDQYCTECLREEKDKPRDSDGPLDFVWNAFKKKRCTSPCCFVCATPVCNRHSCQTDGLRICKDQCKPLLHPQDLMEHLDSLKDNEQERQKFVAHMMDTYDRSLIMLQYACQFENLDELADALEGSSRKHTQFQLGGSSMGFMAGVTGVGAMAGPAATAAKVTAAATLLTPAGPSLLMASLVFGGTAAAATVGHELAIHKFYKSSEEQQRYRKLLAWHAVVTTIATVAGVHVQPPPQQKAAQEEVELSTETAIVVYKPPNKNIFLRNNSISTTRTESMTEWSERSLSLDEDDDDDDFADDDDSVDDDNQGQGDLSEAATRTNDDCNACNPAEDPSDMTVSERELMSTDNVNEEENDRTEATKEGSTGSTGSSGSAASTDREEEEVLASLEDLRDLVVNAEEEEEEEEERGTEEQDEGEMVPLLAVVEDSVDDGGVEEQEGSNDQEIAPLLADNEPSVETVNEDEDPKQGGGLVVAKDRTKNPLACLLPLAPLLDDAVLSVCKVFSDPSGGARMAISRASSHAIKVTQFASVACGALSAVTVFFEAYNMNRSLKRLEGPCSHAEKVRNLHHEVVHLPDTKLIADAMEDYLVHSAAATTTTPTTTSVVA